jgi:O-acetyl-ADP-ribose deacetylase (regulator of RNase III)
VADGHHHVTPRVPIEYRIGDATRPAGAGPKIIAHVGNDVGGWGAGFVLAVSQRWPEPEADYLQWHEGRAHNDFGLGAVRLVRVEPDIRVANMIAQRDIVPGPDGPPIRYDALRTALSTVAQEAQTTGASVHMPRIGCGLAGGDWNIVESIIDRSLSSLGIAAVIYDLP